MNITYIQVYEYYEYYEYKSRGAENRIKADFFRAKRFFLLSFELSAGTN